MKKIAFLSSVIFLLTFSGCIKPPIVNPPDDGYRHGIFIVNEGAMGNSNGSVSHFDPDSLKITNYLFNQANGRPLGDVVQSMTISGNQGFIVVNNSQKVEVVDLKDFSSIGTIDGLTYPRHLLVIDSTKGYLSDGNFEGFVHVIDLQGFTIKSSIPCGKGPERIVQYGDNIMVANSGGFDNDSTITVIDTSKDQLVTTWPTGYNPVDMVFDAQNRLWVMCKGKTIWNADWTLGVETESEIIIHDPTTGAILERITIGMVGDYYWPNRIGSNPLGTRIYFIEAAGMMEIDLTRTGTDPTLLIPGSFYGFGVNPADGQIITLVCPSFTTSGLMVRYSPQGGEIDSYEVGIGPNGVAFN